MSKGELLGKMDREEIDGDAAILIHYTEGAVYVGVAEWLAKQLTYEMIETILLQIREALSKSAEAEGNVLAKPN